MIDLRWFFPFRLLRQLDKGLEQQALGFRFCLQLCVKHNCTCLRIMPTHGRLGRERSSLLFKLVNQLNQFVADINRRNLGLGLRGLFNCRRLRRFGGRFRSFSGGLILGDECAAGEDKGEGELHA